MNQLFHLDGIRIASANTIEMLMEHDFDMIVNDKVYRVLTPPQEKASKVYTQCLSFHFSGS